MRNNIMTELQRACRAGASCEILALPAEVVRLCSSFLDEPSFVSFSHSCETLRTLLDAPALEPESLYVFAKEGYLCLLEWYSSNMEGTPSRSLVLSDGAATGTNLQCHANDLLGGHTDILEWLMSRPDFFIAKVATYNAAAAGHVHVLDWLEENGALYIDSNTVIAAAAGGHLPALMWLHYRKAPLPPIVASDALRFGKSFDIVKWLSTVDGFKFPTGSQMTDAAAEIGRLDILQWLHEKHHVMTANTFASAAASGSFEILEWLWNLGFLPTAYAFSRAAKNGRREVCTWLLSKKCPFDGDAMVETAKTGNLEMMQWLHALGCPWGPFTYEGAIYSENWEILKWLKNNGCPMTEHVARVAGQQSLDAFKFVVELGCPVPSTICELALRYGKVKVAHYAKVLGYPWTEEAELQLKHLESWGIN